MAEYRNILQFVSYWKTIDNETVKVTDVTYGDSPLDPYNGSWRDVVMLGQLLEEIDII